MYQVPSEALEFMTATKVMQLTTMTRGYNGAVIFQICKCMYDEGSVVVGTIFMETTAPSIDILTYDEALEEVCRLPLREWHAVQGNALREKRSSGTSHRCRRAFRGQGIVVEGFGW